MFAGGTDLVTATVACRYERQVLQRYVALEGDEAHANLLAHLEALWMRWLSALGLRTTTGRAAVTEVAMRHW